MKTIPPFLAISLACLCVSCGGSDSSSVTDDPERVFAEQQQRYDQQLDKGDEQDRRLVQQLDKADEQNRRFDALLAKWEDQAIRQDRILAEQEKRLGVKTEGKQ